MTPASGPASPRPKLGAFLRPTRSMSVSGGCAAALFYEFGPKVRRRVSSQRGRKRRRGRRAEPLAPERDVRRILGQGACRRLGRGHRVPSRHGRLAPSLREVTKLIVRSVSMPSTREWIDSLAAELGVPEPTDEEIESLLALAGSAAHAAERTAAPLSCWLVGVAGLAPAEARVAVERLAARLQLPAS